MSPAAAAETAQGMLKIILANPNFFSAVASRAENVKNGHGLAKYIADLQHDLYQHYLQAEPKPVK